jgi:hypothetical protein
MEDAALLNDGEPKALTVMLTSFGFACIGFFIGMLLILPLLAKLATLITVPDPVMATMVFIGLFGTPVIGALLGINVFSRSS